MAAARTPTRAPLGAISSAALLLRHTAGLEQEARDVEWAVRRVLDAGYRTADLRRDGANHFRAGTEELGTLICDAIAESADMRHAYHAV